MKFSTFSREELKTKIPLMHHEALTGVFFGFASLFCVTKFVSEQLNIRNRNLKCFINKSKEFLLEIKLFSTDKSKMKDCNKKYN